MARFFISMALLGAMVSAALPEAPPASAPPPSPSTPAEEEPPEGYYAFVESPNATPPRVRPPPYRQEATPCPGEGSARAHVSAHNLCGDLNRGSIPLNPITKGQDQEPYPFELIRNHTLRFLSRTLPVLRADDTLPRVRHLAQTHGQHYQPPGEHEDIQYNSLEERAGRSLGSLDSLHSQSLPFEHRASNDDVTETPRESRKFCDGGGVFCMLYRAINGDGSPAGVERREDPGAGGGPGAQGPLPAHTRYEGPPTPCPARVEYATPVFARNYQGVWRYVVQIPYEGYFTQTVEVTRCMQSRCHYLEGGCLSSPRWVSLLVAELHYPQQETPVAAEQPQQPQPAHCDGQDERGCYQVRLYYDWFLVPGSCKCWRPDYFARYVRRRQGAGGDL